MTNSRFNETAQRTQLRRWARTYIQYGNDRLDRDWGKWDDLTDLGQNDHFARPEGLEELAARPYVLVETSRYGQTWVTLFDSPEAAAMYHFSQEYAEDWDIEELYDLRDPTVRFQVEIVPKITRVVLP